MSNCLRLVVLCACASLALAQYGDYSFGFGGFPLTSFGAPGVNYGMMAASARDPRGNTGPVLFPPSPPDDGSQTSGVIVGASGYGFVPPGGQGAVPRYFYQGFFLR